MATAVRVPVYVGMSQSVQVDFTAPINADEAREVIGDTPGTRVVDEPGIRPVPPPLAGGQPGRGIGRPGAGSG